MSKKVKINILSPGRFHVCDLARELDKNGFDVRFYSYVPTKRAVKFGLPKKCSSSLLFFMVPFLFLEKKLFKKVDFFRRLRVVVQDGLTALVMRRCDILIAMSGDFAFSLKSAKKHGATIILERGSKHILEQKRILDQIPTLKGKTTIPRFNIKRELQGYELADFIAIASKHVEKSFIDRNYPLNKLFINPYGVDLSMFKPYTDKDRKYDFIMVGNWSYQKGCDLIIKAILQSKFSFLHVGAIKDLAFPKDTRFTHVDPVDQFKLQDYYNQAKVFLFPSRQDGFGMVLSQAVACNLPIVASPDCGAPDLKTMVLHPEYILLINDYTVDELLIKMRSELDLRESLYSSYAGNAIENLTWEAYGKRYTNFINSNITL